MKISGIAMRRSMALAFLCIGMVARAEKARNPIIWVDVPDLSIIRVGDNYYMSSTTMHMSPGLPIMKSKDLVNWNLVGYAYDRLLENDKMNLENGQSAYGKGSWASSLRYHNGTYLRIHLFRDLRKNACVHHEGY